MNGQTALGATYNSATPAPTERLDSVLAQCFDLATVCGLHVERLHHKMDGTEPKDVEQPSASAGPAGLTATAFSLRSMLTLLRDELDRVNDKL